MQAYVHIYMFIDANVYGCVCVYVCACMCMCMCMRMYMYMYMYMFIHILYVYIYVYLIGVEIGCGIWPQYLWSIPDWACKRIWYAAPVLYS